MPAVRKVTSHFAPGLAGLLLWTGPGTKALTLVKAGHATSLIVTSRRPTDGQVLAAQELAEHLRIMTGARLLIVPENEYKPKANRATILIGGSSRVLRHGVDTSKMAPETFVVKTVGNVLILAGEDGGRGKQARMGTLWAVYDFLQDQLGCRWIWPGDIGRVVPRRGTVVVNNLDIRETPLIKLRKFRAANQPKHRALYLKQGLGKFFDLNETYDRLGQDERTWLRRMRMGRSFKLPYGHGFTRWWKKYKDTAPDIFALQPNGRRGPKSLKHPDYVKMCVSNPKLWELQLAPLKRAAAKGARGLWVNACENDGSGGFCTCKRCRSWDADPNADLAVLPEVEDGSDVDAEAGKRGASGLPECLSDRYARWYNELARRARAIDPDARVIGYAYSRYRKPPTKIRRIEPNVWIGYVGFNAYPRPVEYAKTAAEEWLGWSRLGARVFLRSNSLFYCGEGAPYVVTHQMAADTHFQLTHGLRAADYDCLQGYWAATGPTYYVLARLLWDTNADPDRLLDEFYRAFGPMKPVARKYFDYWEAFTEHLGNDPEFMRLRRLDRLRAYSRLYSPAVLAAARSILQQAGPLLPKASKEERERFRNIVLGLEHGRLLVAALRDGIVSNGSAGRELLAFRRKIASRNVLNVYWTTSKEIRYRVFK